MYDLVAFRGSLCVPCIGLLCVILYKVHTQVQCLVGLVCDSVLYLWCIHMCVMIYRAERVNRITIMVANRAQHVMETKTLVRTGKV